MRPTATTVSPTPHSARPCAKCSTSSPSTLAFLTSIPSPISEWRPGDARDDERWRALTEVERREVLALASGYDNLITWAEQMAGGQMELAALLEMSGGSLGGQSVPRLAQPPRDTVDYLKAERTRVARFRQEMRFLTRRSPTD
jgi:hypothetical protein